MWCGLRRPLLLLLILGLLTRRLALRLLTWRLVLWWRLHLALGLLTRLPLVLLLILTLLARHARRIVVTTEITLARRIVVKLLPIIIVGAAIAWRPGRIVIALETIVITIVIAGLTRPVSAAGRVSLIAIIRAAINGTTRRRRPAIPIWIVSVPIWTLRPAIPIAIEITAAIVAVPIVVEIESDRRNAEWTVIFRTDIDAPLLIDRLDIFARYPATAADKGNITPRRFRQAAIDGQRLTDGDKCNCRIGRAGP